MTGHGRKGDKFKKGSKFTGLSLDKFIKAKKSTYDPREVKERERARAAITIAKYKKLKSRLQRASNIPTGQQENGEEEGAVLAGQRGIAADGGGVRESQAAADREVGTEGRSSKKRERQLELEKRKEEEAVAAAAKAAEREAAIKRRKADHKLLKKKTRHGQPVMKHRIEKMLQQLEKQ